MIQYAFMSRRRFGRRFAMSISIVLALTLCGWFGFNLWEYMVWRNKMIEWDFGTINRLCGGDTDQERLLDIRFVKRWEYKAQKRTIDGKEVWLHWKLSKRHCGNWTLIDKPDGYVISPLVVRFPDGAPSRKAVTCIGVPISITLDH